MKLLLFIVCFITLAFSSCINDAPNSEIKNKSGDSLTVEKKSDEIKKADWDRRQNEYYHSIERQINVTNLEKGADSADLRLWIDRAFSSMTSLYSLHLQDSLAFFTYAKVYLKPFDWDKDDPHKWDPLTSPIVDSIKSVSILVTSSMSRKIISEIKIDSIFLLPSQNEIKGNFGALDGESYFFAVASKNRYRFLYYNNPLSSYQHTREKNHERFLHYTSILENIAYNMKVYDRIR